MYETERIFKRHKILSKVRKKGKTMLNNHRSHNRAHTAWSFLLWIVVVALLVSGCGGAQQPKVYHVGVLSGLDAFAPSIDGLKSKLTEFGYAEGKNIVYDVQKTNIDPDAYKKIVQKFVQDKVDLIFVFPTEATMEAKAGTQNANIPVVFDLAFTDVPGIDLINSIREPGGNITGVRFPSIDIATKRLELLLEMVPTAKRIWVPYLKGYPNVPGQLDAIRAVAQKAGVTLTEFGATSPQDLKAELDKRAASGDTGMDAILLIAEPLSITPDFFTVLAKFGYEHKIPIGGAPMTVGDYGTIFGLLPNAKRAGEQAALIVDKVLKGTPAGTIPVTTTDSDLQINVKAAQAMGAKVPDGLLQMANNIVR
jgi:putative ABC transport system substrate-binding protein